MSKTVNSKILVRRDTSTNWSTNNPVLAAGEIGFDTTVGKHKIGDGSTAWNSLPYFLLETGNAHRTLAIPYAEVDSTSTGTVFTATVDGITELYDGVCVYLKNGVVSSASGWTLNINNLGAKPVYQSQAAASRTTTIFNVAYTALFIYNSTRVEDGCWDYFYGYNSDTNTTAYQIRQNQSILTMYAALTRYKICFSRFDDTILPSTATSNSTGTSKTLTTDSFNPFGPIYYYSTTTGVAAGESPGASYMWIQYPTVDLRYSFNAGTTLTAKQTVYVKCVPQADGSFKLSGNDCIVQTLPNTEDGYVYLSLGKAYSTYQIVFESFHPGYYYKDGAIRLWVNEKIENTLFVEVEGTYDEQNDTFEYEISNNVTYANIASAIENNKNVVVILIQDNEYKQYFNLSYFNYDDSNQPIIFANNFQENICTLEIDSNSDVSISNEYDLSNYVIKSRSGNGKTYIIQNENEYDFGLGVVKSGQWVSGVWIEDGQVNIVGNAGFFGQHVGVTNQSPPWQPTWDTDFTTKEYVDTLTPTAETDANVIAMLANFGLNTTTQLQPATIGTTTAGASVLKL